MIYNSYIMIEAQELTYILSEPLYTVFVFMVGKKGNIKNVFSFHILHKRETRLPLSG